MARKLKSETKVSPGHINVLTLSGVSHGYEVEPAFDYLAERRLDKIIEAVKAGRTKLYAELVEVNRKTKATTTQRYTQDQFIQKLKESEKRMREFDSFSSTDLSQLTPGLVGDDYVPLLGGPFNKQQYLQSYLQGQAECFHAYHHDPFARAAGSIIKHFTLGKGYRADCENPAALALWKAFEEANKLQEFMGYTSLEFFIQGEIMVYWIPDGATSISINNPKELQPKKWIIPRVRLLDTSAIWEVITLPEDIQRVFAYQQVYISQYQQYSTKVDGATVPISKTIIRQIPADQVDHHKVNCISGEKRGRSDLYPVLGFLKRLRDVIQYSIIQKQKQAAYSFDTTIEGSDDDLRQYSDAIKALGEVPPAGSEYVHTKKVTRQLMSTTGDGGASQAFEWTLSCIAAGLGIPVNYFGTHLSGGQTRASAMIATEPVTKKFEDRQETYKAVLKAMARRLFRQNNIDAEIEFTFPELITDNRSAKLTDLRVAQEAGWFSRERCAEMAAKEFSIHDFKFADENTEEQAMTDQGPLTTAPRYTGVTSEDRRAVKQELPS